MSVKTVKLYCATITLAGGLGASGCVYSGGSADTLERPGPPLGITVLRVPWERFVFPPPPPGGFSGTYQQQVVERQRLARLQAEREAQAKSTTAAEQKPASSS